MNKRFCSTLVFQKFVMGITGLALVGFIVTHLIGNLLLLKADGTAFNEYAEKLASFGWLLYIAEAGLVAFFLTHAYTGIMLFVKGKAAKGQGYAVYKSKGGPSKSNTSSRTMAITGSLLLAFLVYHVIHFKYGPGLAEGYSTTLASLTGGHEARDLQRLVHEQFKIGWVVAIYAVGMCLLGFHLRHGVWSALQSLGLTRDNNSGFLYKAGMAIGLALAAGFLSIPLYVYFCA